MMEEQERSGEGEREMEGGMPAARTHHVDVIGTAEDMATT